MIYPEHPRFIIYSVTVMFTVRPLHITKYALSVYMLIVENASTLYVFLVYSVFSSINPSSYNLVASWATIH